MISLSVLLSILCAGCTEKPDGISEENKDTAVDTRQQEIMDESLEIAERYRDIYEAAEKTMHWMRLKRSGRLLNE